MSTATTKAGTEEISTVGTLRISEIFYSLQGEADTAGAPTVFVRLTGCPMRCQYCDTEYAFTGGERKTVEQILQEVGQYKTRLVTVTGGEPLAQRDVHHLLSRLCDNGYQVSLETGGSIDIQPVDPRVSIVLDIKTPGSGESERNRLDNLGHISSKDQIKFVICDRSDYEWSRDFVMQHRLDRMCTVWFSPSYGQVEARDLADWILQDHLPVRLQLQLHKSLWGDERGR
ncbi:MAG: 7-carboxy-7-deazaguanine synthase QueE [Acidiferrobacterales bacterium]